MPSASVSIPSHRRMNKPARRGLIDVWQGCRADADWSGGPEPVRGRRGWTLTSHESEARNISGARIAGGKEGP